MRNKNIWLLGMAGLSLLLSSCTYDKDPFLDFKNEAKAAYKKFYEDNPSLTKDPLFYFDIETLRGALVRSENEVSFLGQFKITDFTFSESTNYFADIGNLPLKVEDSDNDGSIDGVTLGDFVNTVDGNVEFDVKTFLNNLPLVLHETLSDGSIATYSMVNKDGEVLDTSNAKAYNPDFFYISDLSISIDGLSDYTDSLLNFEGKDVCILRKDVYSQIANLEEAMIPTEFQNFISVSDIFNGLYRKSKGLKSNDEMPSSLTIEGTHYTNFEDSREVVVGPFSLINKIISSLMDGDNSESDTTSRIHDVDTIYIGEGVKTISFFAFDGSRTSDEELSTSSIKNVYLPSSLSTVQFNAFSNLDLENLYVPKTYNDQNIETAFETVDFGEATLEFQTGNEAIELNVTGSFSHTNIENIYFENYDNLNINSFPYSSTINLSSTNGINEALKIYHNKDGVSSTDKFKTFEEAFNYTKIINPFYEMDMLSDDNKKYSLNLDVDTLANGQVIYLPHEVYSLDTTDSRQVTTTKSAKEGAVSEAFITLKLDSDLTISDGGQIIIGSQIGQTSGKSGVNVGNFAALDLNGHNLTIKNGGSIIGDGYIYDSKNEGKVVLESGSTLSTNLTINDYLDFNHVYSRIEEGIAPFDKYSLNSLLVDVEVNKGATIKTHIDYVGDDSYNENTINFISDADNSLFQINSGKLVVNKSKISSIDNETKVAVNAITLLTIKDDSSFLVEEDEFGTNDSSFAIANATFDVSIGNLTINTKVKVSSDSNLIINNLVMGNNGYIVSTGDNALYVTGSISLVDTDVKATIAGSIRTDSLASILQFLKTRDGNLTCVATEKSIDESDTSVVNEIVYSLEVYEGTSSKEYVNKIIKNSNGYYYYLTSNGASGGLYNNADDNLASYDETSSYWYAYDDGTSVETTISKENLITSYIYRYTSYILSNVDGEYNWKYAGGMSTDGLYTVDGKTYINPINSSELVEGNIIENTPIEGTFFKASNSNKIYAKLTFDYYDISEWFQVEVYDNYNVYRSISSYANNNYFGLIEGSYQVLLKYDSTTHIATYNYDGSTEQRTFAYTNENRLEEFDGGLNWELKQIDSSTGKFIYLKSKSSWARVDELHKGLCKSNAGSTNFYYYFLINDVWYQSIEGENALRYNDLADYSFGVLKDKLTYNGTKYKFVMKKGDNDEDSFSLFLPQEMVKVYKSDFSDLWPSNATTDHLFAYRHIVRNGKKYLFYKNEVTGKVEEKAFEFAPGFTPSQINPDNDNILTKFNFIIYKVIFEGETTIRTIYIIVDSSDSDNAIYAGNASQDASGEVSDDYIALAIFTNKNPINDLTGGGSN